MHSACHRKALQLTEIGGLLELPPVSMVQTSLSWVALPSPAQVWAHSICSRKDLAKALADDNITAIESDVIVSKGVVVMAHPPAKTSDLTLQEFLNACHEDGRRHIKLDFKSLEAAMQSLAILAEMRSMFVLKGQAVILNADIVPGPGCSAIKCSHDKRLAEGFLQAVAEYCPGAPVSLGWGLNPFQLGGKLYTEAHCNAMAAAYENYARAIGNTAAGGVVFAAWATAAIHSPKTLAALLGNVPGSQLLLWRSKLEGTMGSVAKTQILQLKSKFEELGVGDRVGYDLTGGR